MDRRDDSTIDWAEEIQGAPPAQSHNELHERRLTETITLNRYLYQQAQQLEHMLLSAPNLESQLEILLINLPRHFSFRVSELWLYDPEDMLSGLIVNRHRYGSNLRLMRDVFDLQDLYEPEPGLTLIDATDSRMFEVLKAADGVTHALLMPLLEAGRLVGSLNWGLVEPAVLESDDDIDLLGHLGSVISICFQNAVSRQRLAQLSLLDPQTEISNRRSFEVELAREIARARRANAPMTLLVAQIDDYRELAQYRGRADVDFLVKKIAERLEIGLRATDSLARLAEARMAVLLPSAHEVAGEEIAERMRLDLDEQSIDDGCGGVLHATVSIGFVTWEPQAYPAVDMRQLARQLESAAVQACERADQAGGNRVQLARLKTLIF